MNLLDDISKWLSTPSKFSEGVQLYHRAGLKKLASRWDQVLIRNIVTQSDKDALILELTLFLQANQYSHNDTPVIVVPGPSRDREPSEIQHLRERARELRKQYSLLHSRLGACDNDIDRYEIAREIMEVIIPEEDRVWSSIRRWEQKGIIPQIDESKDVVSQVVKKMQLLYNYRTRASKYKAQLNKKEDPSIRVKYNEMLANVADIEQELGINAEP